MTNSSWYRCSSSKYYLLDFAFRISSIQTTYKKNQFQDKSQFRPYKNKFNGQKRNFKNNQQNRSFYDNKVHSNINNQQSQFRVNQGGVMASSFGKDNPKFNKRFHKK